MSKLLEVKEFDSIVGIKVEDNNEKGYLKYLPEPAFHQLVTFIEEYEATATHADAMDFFRIYRTKDRKLGEHIAVNNYVGLIQLKSGYQVQILPKIDFAEKKCQKCFFTNA